MKQSLYPLVVVLLYSSARQGSPDTSLRPEKRMARFLRFIIPVLLALNIAASLAGCAGKDSDRANSPEGNTPGEYAPSRPAAILLAGLGFGESPRWHDGRLWFSNWGKQEIGAVDLDGKSEVMAHVSTSLPFCIDWLPDGRLLVVSGPERLLLRREPDGSLVTHADLQSLAQNVCNEIVVDGRGNIYVNGGGFERPGQQASGIIALVTPEGLIRQVADGLAFPNGMVVTPDNSTLIVAESFAKKLTAFDIAADGSLSHQQVWADLGEGVPDGICIDAENAVWYADTPNKRCVRVRKGGEVLETINVDRGCFACMLGGPDKKTLFIMAAEWHGFEKMMEGLGSGQVLTIAAPARGVGWP